MACNYRKGEYRCPICGEDMNYDRITKGYTCKNHHKTVILGPNFFKFVSLPVIETVKVRRIGEIDANSLKTEREYLDEKETI